MAKKTAVKETNTEFSDLERMEGAASKKGELVAMAPATQNYIRMIMTEDLVKSLTHIRPEVFERNLFNAIAANQQLLDYPPFYLYREVSKAAALGLLLDPLLGEAYIIEAWDGKKGRKIPQLRVGYKGMLKLARSTGNVAGVWCHEIHDTDVVEVDLGFPKVFHHRPKSLFGDRGPIVGYAAVIAYKDSTFDFEPVSLDECLKIRDRSDAYKAFKAEKIRSTPWATDENEMCKKTAFRRLMKRQDQSPQLREAIKLEDEAEFPHMVEAKAAPDQPKIRPPAPPPEATGAVEPSSAEGSELAEILPPVKPTKKPGKAKAADPEFKKLAGKDLIDYVKQCCENITAEAFKANPDVIDDLWTKIIEPHLKDAFPPDVGEVQGIFNKMVSRLQP
jgi:phage RecT family recombinase